ncbi:superoxide dismutase family protein [Skermania sp. ID1734]|uniref:superoxide dismutase[Cu-Zn] n=1 Tax=Skermania sp. ID1734 TaxID=2597516 RepID=UPI001180F86F|nr:superoxide dismutase family protein [Skermania sp. ID1734]TSD99404.1 superoxide dismutase family protein [Skermania sp. ID1734]
MALRTVRLSSRIVVPVIAVAALGLAACSNGQEASNKQGGGTPSVFTSAPAPGGASGGETTEPSESAGVTSEPGQGGQSVSTELKDAKGKAVANATFTQEGSYVQIKITAQGLTPGLHGVHVHQVGKCEPDSTAPNGGEPGDFMSAGGHYQAPGHTGTPESGELTTLQIRQDGKGELVTTTDAFTVQEIKADGGHALIIHADADSGPRVACGVLK